MRMNNLVRGYAVGAGAAAMVLVTGCQPPPPGAFADDWAAELIQYGMVPVVPPREDVRVGDLYVAASEPEASSPGFGRILAAGSRWGALPVLAELDVEYRQRPAWPRTPDAFLQIFPTPETRTWAEIAVEEDRSIFSPDTKPKRLRIFGLDAISASTFTEGNVNSLIPTEAINQSLGTAWMDEKAVTLKVSAAESYSLALEKIISLLLDDEPGENGPRHVLKEPHRAHLALVAEPEVDSVWIQVVSEVVYVRSVDISIQSKRYSRDDDELFASELHAAADDGAVTPPETFEGSDDHLLDPVFGAFARAQAINRILIESDADDVPGGFVRFISVTDESISLRRVWQRGLAIGVQGLALEIDKNTGEVVSSRLMP